MGVTGCASVAGRPRVAAARSVGVVSILNEYRPPSSDLSFSHLREAYRDFDGAVRSAGLEEGRVSSTSGGSVAKDELLGQIARFDAPQSLSIVYIASHGTPDGLLFRDELRFEDLYRSIDARTKGKVLLILDSCYSGVAAEVLATHRSSRIYALTGTRGATLERWYEKTGSFSAALAEAVRSRYNPRHDGLLTLGQLYDVIDADIRGWNARFAHRSGPISRPDMYGPRDLVVFDFNG